MKKKSKGLFRRPLKIRGQMYATYAAALLIPLTILGILLMSSGSRILREHSLAVLEADNRRVRTLLSEVTTQAYSISEDVFFDNDLKQVLTREYTAYSDFIAAANGCSKLDDLLYGNQEVGDIHIYTDNPTVKNYKQFRLTTEEIAATDWYTQALDSSGAFWMSIREDTYGNDSSNLCLVRRMVLPDSGYQAVMVVRLRDSYIRARVDSTSVVDAIDLDARGIVYSSRKAWYGLFRRGGGGWHPVFRHSLHPPADQNQLQAPYLHPGQQRLCLHPEHHGQVGAAAGAGHSAARWDPVLLRR